MEWCIVLLVIEEPEAVGCPCWTKFATASIIGACSFRAVLKDSLYFLLFHQYCYLSYLLLVCSIMYCYFLIFCLSCISPDSYLSLISTLSDCANCKDGNCYDR